MGSLKQALKGLSVEFALLADKAAQQGKQEENDVVEKLSLFLDLLQSYKDLCERHEKGVLHKHQRALHKYSLMKRQMMSAAVQNREPESVEQLESRIVEQENVIQTMELRNYFSCTACTRRRSWSTSTCRSPPTSSAPSSTPRSKATRR